MGSLIYLLGLVFAEALRLPNRVRRGRTQRRWQAAGDAGETLEWLVLPAIAAGIWIFPLLFIVIGWPATLDYRLPAWSLLPATLMLTLSLSIRWRAHRALGKRWSHTLETAPEHALVTSGIYGLVRHPIYVSLILWAIAQPVLLPNWLAGWSGFIAVAMLWLVRVPREERMMLDRFGPEYRDYMARTGRLLPRRKASSSEVGRQDGSL
jgi:protein-S-isoprenylcysteine O-methyltransferase Ste14